MSRGIKTEVISFRVPTETAERIRQQAKRVRKPKAVFVKSIFLPAFEAVAAQRNGTPAKSTA